MADSSAHAGAPSLDQILWRAMDWPPEGPTLVDAQEFAEHIAGAFEGETPSEAFVARFFEGESRLHGPRADPGDVADAIVQATRDRLHVYEFEVGRFEYVVVEERDRLVVVSDFGQFVVAKDDAVSRRIASATVAPARARFDRSSVALEPRAWFIPTSGEMAGLDPVRLAGVLRDLFVHRTSAPAVDVPRVRLLPFRPVRRALRADREARVLRQDPRTRQPMPLPPSVERFSDGATDDQTVALLPDGSIARPAIGSATRWREMIGLRPETAASAVAIGDRVVVLLESGRTAPGLSGTRAVTRGEALAAVRSDLAPVRVLGDDVLARQYARGARGIPAPARDERFWVHPEDAVAPIEERRRPPGPEQVLVEPLELGEITGDPWADWAITSGAAAVPARMSRPGRDARTVAPERSRASPPGSVREEIRPAGTAIAAYRAPNGSILLEQVPASGEIRLAGSERFSLRPKRPAASIAHRAGALPATALAALHLAVERTASAGGYRLPRMRIEAATDAVEAGRAQRLPEGDPRRRALRLAAPPVLQGQVARLVLSMPFPDAGAVHVGADLSEALHAWLAAPVLPIAAANPAQPDVEPRTVLEPSAGRIRRGAPPPLAPASPGADERATVPIAPAPPAPRVLGEQARPLVLGEEAMPRIVHEQAVRHARTAALTLSTPDVHALIARHATLAALPPLLMRALEQGGDWVPGPGAPMPLAIHAFALRGSTAPSVAGPPSFAPTERRPPNPGEEEIVIPLPLWAQMGRGLVSTTHQFRTARGAPEGAVPSLGVYRIASGLPAGPPPDASGVDLFGPSRVELSAVRGRIEATPLAGERFLPRVPVAVPEPLKPPGFEGPAAFPHLPAGAGAPPFPASADGRQRSPAAPESPAFAVPSLPAHVSDEMPSLSAGAIGTRLSGATGAGPSAVRSAVSADRRWRPDDAVLPVSSSEAWRGASPVEGGHPSWSYGERRPTLVRRSAIDPSSARPPPRHALPTGLRFRWAGAPLWWSSATRSIAAPPDRDEDAQGAFRSGLHAANFAAALWRSILVSGASSDADSLVQAEAEAGAGPAPSSAPSLAIPPLTPGHSTETVYVALHAAGSGGVMTASAARRAKAEAVEMSIVAAIPPAPPPLESMASAPVAGEAPRTRPRQQPAGAQGPARADAVDAVSHSRIEGSVDAIAQRIYHRIRRRIQMDRERFGG